MQLCMQLYLLVVAPIELEFVETDTRWALHLSGTAPVLLASRAGHLEVGRLLCICQVPRQCCLRLEQGTGRWCVCSVTFRPGPTTRSSTCSYACAYSRSRGWSLWSAQVYMQLYLLVFAPRQLYMQLYLLVFAPLKLEFVETDPRWALHLSGTAPVLLASRAGHLEVVRLLCICQVPRQCCLRLEQGTWRWGVCSVTPCSSTCSSTCSCSRP
jgi:hypothetical protein